MQTFKAQVEQIDVAAALELDLEQPYEYATDTQSKKFEQELSELNIDN